MCEVIVMIRNTTRGTILAEKVKLCDTILSRARGLMFRLPLKAGHAYFFPFNPPERPWIHMLFVFFPIDMVFLDENNKVVHLEEARPFQLKIMPGADTAALLELPPGTIDYSKTQLGDIIETKSS